ncbi:MAG: Hsp33 family molecular chaperone HslO [Woeseiaceae bacterium]|nr:Hsp33 family molecular chaperone HslO [Woeseiaceae bacterium]
MFADHVVPFVFESLPVRGELIYLSRAWRRMLADHDYDAIVRRTLGEAAAATGLIAQSLKFDGSVTLQIQGRGDLRMLVMQCTDELELRGLAAPAPEVTARSFDELMQDAHCAITIDRGDRPYQGIVEVNRESFAASLENYFSRSVQVPSHIALVSNDDLSGGLLLQQMPGQGMADDDWRRLGLLAATLSSSDFLADDATSAPALELIGKLFNEDDVRVFKGRPVVFRCRCSRRRAEDVLRMLGPAEVRAALAEQARLEVTCEYCGRRRHFDAVDASRLFADNVVPGPSRPQ